jgi:hypothetical protein
MPRKEATLPHSAEACLEKSAKQNRKEFYKCQSKTF